MNPRCPELDSIRKVIDLYIDGVRNGNVEAMQQAFHPQASMFGWKGTDVFITPIQGLYDYIASTPVPAKTGDLPTFIITSIQVAGNAATVGLAMDGYHEHDFDVPSASSMRMSGSETWVITKFSRLDSRGVYFHDVLKRKRQQPKRGVRHCQIPPQLLQWKVRSYSNGHQVGAHCSALLRLSV